MTTTGICAEILLLVVCAHPLLSKSVRTRSSQGLCVPAPLKVCAHGGYPLSPLCGQLPQELGEPSLCPARTSAVTRLILLCHITEGNLTRLAPLGQSTLSQGEGVTVLRYMVSTTTRPPTILVRRVTADERAGQKNALSLGEGGLPQRGKTGEVPICDMAQ